MKVGDEYVSVKLVGHESVAAFPNKDKKEGDNKPDFIANGIAVWKKKKKAPKQPNQN